MKTRGGDINSGDSSVGRASDWRSEGRVFDPRSPHLDSFFFFWNKMGFPNFGFWVFLIFPKPNPFQYFPRKRLELRSKMQYATKSHPCWFNILVYFICDNGNVLVYFLSGNFDCILEQIDKAAKGDRELKMVC